MLVADGAIMGIAAGVDQHATLGHHRLDHAIPLHLDPDDPVAGGQQPLHRAVEPDRDVLAQRDLEQAALERRPPGTKLLTTHLRLCETQPDAPGEQLCGEGCLHLADRTNVWYGMSVSVSLDRG